MKTYRPGFSVVDDGADAPKPKALSTAQVEAIRAAALARSQPKEVIPIVAPKPLKNAEDPPAAEAVPHAIHQRTNL
jgi:hypothetical protein